LRGAAPGSPAAALRLDADEQELIGLELDGLGPVRSPERRRAWEDLARAAAGGSVPAELVPLLERLVAVSLESGRARRRYLAEGERVLTRLFRRTPSGRELQESLNGVNEALEVLHGRKVESVEVALRTLGHIRVALDTDGVRLVLSVRPGAVLVESLTVTGSEG
jgi:hypothetical protein